VEEQEESDLQQPQVLPVLYTVAVAVVLDLRQPLEVRQHMEAVAVVLPGVRAYSEVREVPVQVVMVLSLEVVEALRHQQLPGLVHLDKCV
jgi:hypothetical protein